MSDERGTLRNLDELARRATRRQFTRPLVLEAGAGTGKTAALVGRVLVWCLGPGWERSRAALAEEGASPLREAIAARVLERVTAITFTERAAAEMADRIAAALTQLQRGEAPVGLELAELGSGELERGARAAALLGCLDRLAVSTIHGYCHRLLASHPLEAGLHPSFRVDADGRALRAAAQELLAERMGALYGAPADPDALLLAARGAVGPAEVAAALETLAAARVPVVELEGDPCRPERVAETVGRLSTRLTALLALLRPALGRASSGRMKVATAAWVALEALERRLAEAGRDVAALRAAVAGPELEAAQQRLRQWARGQLTLAERAALGGEERALASASASLLRTLGHVRQLEPELLRAACRLLAPLLAELERRLRARGIESFDGLLEDARTLLRDHAGVRRRVQRATDQLLVDEFQDTDPIQCAIVRLLALDGDPAERPGLFLVGDPKQSIYGWRSADLEAYDDFVAELCAQGGERHTLAVNFRSSREILDEVERVVTPIMLEERGVQPPFQRLLASGRRAEPLSGERAPVEHWIPRARGAELRRHAPADRARRIEASAVARDMIEQHRLGVPWSSFAILLRTTSPLELYLQALRETGIPFVVERDRSYYRRREVIDAAALLRAVLDPSDQLALLTTLRTSPIGVPDAALVPLFREGLPELVAHLGGPDTASLEALSRAVDVAATSLEATRLPGLERLEGWPLSLKAALRTLAELRRSFEVDPADRFLERLRSSLLLEETEAARYLGPHRLANLDRFFRQVLAMLERPEVGVQAMLRELRTGVAGAREEEEGVLADESLDAVRVLTIHKAKGLTFDQVYAVGLHGRSQGRSSATATEVARCGDRFELRLFGARSLGLDQAEERRARVEQAELVRTFYVAMTRPRHRLVLAGSWPDAGARRPLERIRSHMDLLQHRRGERPELDAGGPAASEGGVRWVSFEELPEASLAARQDERSLAITPAEARRELALLEEARAGAAARMARPFSAAASALGHRVERESVAGEPDPVPAPDASSPRALIALAVGSATHRLLERLDLRAPVEEAVARELARLEAELPLLPPELRRAVAAETREIALRLSRSSLLARLRSLAGFILARELPILLAPPSLSTGPAGVVVGTIDLLYRDPATGAPVVADYKTDRIRDASALETRAQVHLEQGRVYLRAVQQALAAAPPARLELWFLAADRVLCVG